MQFWLGTDRAHWLGEAGIPLMVSRRVLVPRKTLPRAAAPWVLDSGGFTELHLTGSWDSLHPRDYAALVIRWAGEIGELAWAAPQDWMCEPHMLRRTGKTVREHQYRTVANFLDLRERLGRLVIPVLQGWDQDDYHRCWQIYEDNDVPLQDEPVVGLGSVCRRQDTVEAGLIVRSLAPLRLHGFGVKLTGLDSFRDGLVSADSMAWSVRARHAAAQGEDVLPGYCQHKAHNHCLPWALRWRDSVLQRLAQLSLLEEPA